MINMSGPTNVSAVFMNIIEFNRKIEQLTDVVQAVCGSPTMGAHATPGMNMLDRNEIGRRWREAINRHVLVMLSMSSGSPPSIQQIIEETFSDQRFLLLSKEEHVRLLGSLFGEIIQMLMVQFIQPASQLESTGCQIENISEVSVIQGQRSMFLLEGYRF